MENEGQGPATPGTAARCEDDLDLIASALGLTPYQGSNNRTIHEAEDAVSRLRVLVERARAETLNEAAREVDLVAAEYIGQAGEAEFDPNWIAGESLQGAAERIRSLISAGGGAEGPRAAPPDPVPEIERLKAENASLLESLRAAEDRAVLARSHLNWIIGFAETVGQSGLLHNACRAREALLAGWRVDEPQVSRPKAAPEAPGPERDSSDWDALRGLLSAAEQRAEAAEKERDELREERRKRAEDALSAEARLEIAKAGLLEWKRQHEELWRGLIAQKDRAEAAEQRNTELEGALREWAEAVRAVDTFIDFGTPAESAEDPWVAPTEPEEMNAAMLRLYELLKRYDAARAALHDEERPHCTPMRCRVGLDFHHCEEAGHLAAAQGEEK